MLYGVVVVLMWSLVSRIWRKGRSAIRGELARSAAILGATAALAGVLYAPVIVVAGLGALTSNEYLLPQSFFELLFAVRHQVGLLLREWTANTPVPIVVLAAAGILLDTVRSIRQRTTPSLLLVSLSVLPVFVVMQRVAPPARTLHVFLPFAWMSAASGLVAAGRNLIGSSHLRRIVTLVAATSLAVVWGIRSGRSDYIASLDIEEETVAGGETFARKLAPLLRSRDRVATAFPATQAIRFGLMRAGVGEFFQRSKRFEGQRLIVVLHEGNRRTTVDVARVLKSLRLQPIAGAVPDTLLHDGALTAVAITRFRTLPP
jgi:hypothetical protein